MWTNRTLMQPMHDFGNSKVEQANAFSAMFVQDDCDQNNWYIESILHPKSKSGITIVMSPRQT